MGEGTKHRRVELELEIQSWKESWATNSALSLFLLCLSLPDTKDCCSVEEEEMFMRGSPDILF